MQLPSLSLQSPRVRAYALILIIALIIFVVLVTVKTVFTVRRISLAGATPESIKGMTAFSGKSIFLLSTKKVEQALFDSNPQLSDVDVEKQYPDGLNITVRTQKPIAYLEVSNGYFLLSASGRVLQKIRQKEAEYPTIIYYQKLNYTFIQSGDVIDYQDITTALHFLTKLRELGMVINTIDIVGSDVIALNGQDNKIMVTTEKDTSLQDYQLESIIRQFKIEGKDFKVLDVRFDKPVVDLD